MIILSTESDVSTGSQITVNTNKNASNGSQITVNTNKTNSSYRRYLERGEYVTAIERSIEYEKKGDKLIKLGRNELAQREYKKVLVIEEAILGEEHPVVSSFREKIAIEDDHCWQRSTLRKAMDAIYTGLKHEKHGDYLLKNGLTNQAKAEYEKALKIETAVLGEDHPMTSSMKQKIIISTK
ncbi:MAG: hypothetical protein SGILL_009427 [Bacillariaceae sp.]